MRARQFNTSLPTIQPPDRCCYCGAKVDPSNIGSAMGDRLLLCEVCTDALDALRDGAADALAIFRREVKK